MSAKRKAAAAAAMADSPDPKRRKLPPLEKETPERTTTVGLELLSHVKNTRDKRGRLIATEFLTLPDKDELPEYYEITELPIALDVMEEKLKQHLYPNMTTLESDFKRMVSNAKHFNEKTSEIHSDAEKIRKMISMQMSKLNPAYRDPDYVAFPTPIPSRTIDSMDDETEIPEKPSVKKQPESPVEDAPKKPRRSVILHGPSAEKEEIRRRASSTPAVQDTVGAGENFKGNTFQQAQEKIMIEMINLTNDDGELISGPFLNLPPRDLRDYYQVVRHPMCLRSVQKLVRGVRGREKPTGISVFKNWQAFEDEMNLIWDNARLYNEDGSEISEVAGQLQAYFNRRIAEAKRAVSEPSQPRVKLRMSVKEPEHTPKITFRMAGPKPNSELAAAPATGTANINANINRQQALTEAGANGHSATPANGEFSRLKQVLNASNSSVVPASSVLARDKRSTSAGSLPGTATGVKAEGLPAVPSPPIVIERSGSNLSSDASASVNPLSNMPPPSNVTPRIPSSSPHPQIMHTNHITNPLDSRWRQPGKDAFDALISNLVISTHPGLKISRHFRLSIPPSPVLSQQSLTINLPATHYCLQISPVIALNATTRQSKIFVTMNNQRLPPTPPAKLEDADPQRPVYEARVVPGVNRLEVEMIAGPARGVPKVGTGSDVELEKITVFLNVSHQV